MESLALVVFALSPSSGCVSYEIGEELPPPTSEPDGAAAGRDASVVTDTGTPVESDGARR